MLSIVCMLPAPFASALADEGSRSFWLGISLGAAVLVALPTCLIFPIQYVRRRRDELGAGYTTLVDRYLDHWQLAPDGRVVRAPGAASASRDIRER